MIAKLPSSRRRQAGALLAAALFASTVAAASETPRPVLILTSTNDASRNSVAVFALQPVAAGADVASAAAAPAHSAWSLTLAQTLPTGGSGGASGNGGILQFKEDAGAVANFGSNTVTRLKRRDDAISVEGTLKMAPDCVQPDSVALAHDHLYIVGANCAESHTWHEGYSEPGAEVVKLTDATAGQIAVGETWAAVTLKSGSVLQLPLSAHGALNGHFTSISLPSEANSVPLGAAFWDDTLGFDPAHSVDSFAVVTPKGQVYPVAGPAPAFPSNAPCWIAKGRGNIWYTGNSPGQAISIFFSDAQGGVFYKSVSVPGVITDLSTSPDGRWLAAIYTANGSGYVTVFAVGDHGDLKQVATSSPIGAASFNGVAISQ